jgi:plasmid stabilization system protein ParE
VKIRISSAAYRDLDRGRQFYARLSPSAGSYFLDSLINDIDALSRYAGVHAVIFGYHRQLARRFPVAIYYRVIAGECLVYRVLDCRRDPRANLDELRRSSRLTGQ